ncbi:hypothetical protein [Actinoallomurus sp. CA-142502]|uniref:hypothetical protein n=1 Tax=Actinoallomurus sp. CA-142502 TaxID=3239885 RepID=UPI003D9490F6
MVRRHRDRWAEPPPLWLWRLPEFDRVIELARTDLSGDTGNRSPAVARYATARLDGRDVLVTGGGDGRVVRVEPPAATAPARDHRSAPRRAEPRAARHVARSAYRPVARSL